MAKNRVKQPCYILTTLMIFVMSLVYFVPTFLIFGGFNKE